MRNALVHFYFGVNLGKVWKTVVGDIPVLKLQIAAILKELGPGSLPSAEQDSPVP